MAKVLNIKKSVNEGFKEFLEYLLKNGKVKGILTLLKHSNNGNASYSLVTSSDLIKDALPFSPMMPSNAANILSKITLLGPVAEPIAVVVRPCELRAFIELVKRNQGNMENIFFISSTCGGVYPIEMTINGKINEKIRDYWEFIKKNEINSDLRPTCNACEEFVPYNADMTVSLIGNSNIDNMCTIFLNTDRAVDFAKDAEGEIIEGEIDIEKINELREKRAEEKVKLFDEKKIEEFSLDGLIEIFGRCIGCHACGSACPICYCSLCHFDSKDSEYKPYDYVSELDKKGAVRIPTNTILYQVGRLLHVGISCVGCGSCADVCPSDIPLSTIFLKVGGTVQKTFDYTPGKDTEEPLPILTFNPEEFSEIET